MTDQIVLNPGERIDDLQRDGYRLIQNPSCFCFGMDAVLLACFARAGEEETVLDLGTGNGVIPILMSARTKGKHFTGLEIQEISADLAERNVRLNHLEEKVEVVRGDIREASAIFGRGKFSVVTTNPPYMRANHGLVNPDSVRAIARHEVLCSLEDIVREAAACLQDRGRLYMVHRPQRLVELFQMMTRYRLEPKRMRMVHPYVNKNANMVLIEAVKGGHTELRTEPPLVVYKPDGTYTEELRQAYGEESRTGTGR